MPQTSDIQSADGRTLCRYYPCPGEIGTLDQDVNIMIKQNDMQCTCDSCVFESNEKVSIEVDLNGRLAKVRSALHSHVGLQL